MAKAESKVQAAKSGLGKRPLPALCRLPAMLSEADCGADNGGLDARDREQFSIGRIKTRAPAR